MERVYSYIPRARTSYKHVELMDKTIHASSYQSIHCYDIVVLLLALLQKPKRVILFITAGRVWLKIDTRHLGNP